MEKTARQILLEDKSLTCVIEKEGQIYKSSRRGVAPLIEFLENKIDLKNSCAADKVVGRGAAFLYVLLGVKELYAQVLSSPAADILSSSKIKYECDTLVPFIKNRSGDGYCPIETSVLDISSPDKALEKIYETLKKLNVS